MIRVLLADDQELVRTGFRLILSGEPGLEFVGEARDGAEAAALSAELVPDVVPMDVRVPRVDGIGARPARPHAGRRARLRVRSREARRDRLR
jgi:YesN/AraC family two-component response regulator